VIFDAEEREDSWFRDQSFDVCVVGSGPAGITLARALALHGRTVGLFEGGDEIPTIESQEIYAGDIVGVDYVPLDAARLRYLGGTSNHWKGKCRPLDSLDFASQAANPNSGWPIEKSDLDSYISQADDILDLEPGSWTPNRFSENLSPLQPIVFRRSAPTRFGAKYREELEKSTKIQLYLNANLVDAGLDESQRRVTELKFKSFKRSETFAAKADHFVLCLGGIENARFLLNTRPSQQYAIGNQHDLVGRTFCEHLCFDLGLVLFKPKSVGLDFLGPEAGFMDRQHILNFGLEFERNRARSRSYLAAFGCSLSLTRQLAEAIGALECDAPGLLKISAEQALNPESRVRLADEVDRFGLRRIALDWRLSEVDARTVRIAALECARVLAKLDIARVKLADWLFDANQNIAVTGQGRLAGGKHHMCTTRMSADPKRGVVDADCRIHGMENLYLGGSSVFATAGCSNPTYTIVQLALRLADHLDSQLT
jgi:choline dehydrogenase-like flavoprotein